MGFTRKEQGKHVFDAVEVMNELVINGQGEVTKTGPYTVVAADSGLIIKVTGTTTITLPSTALGINVRIQNANPNGVGITVAPAAVDQIVGNGFTAADNKAAINTAATAKTGDYIDLIGNGAAGWNVTSVKGIWARQA